MAHTTNKQAPITSDDLHAYVDGHLAPARNEMVERYLVENPLEAAKVADYQKINLALGTEFGPILREPIPVEHLEAARSRQPPPLLQIAAALTLIAIGSGFGWVANNVSSPQLTENQRFAQNAEAAYSVYAPEVLHPIEVAAGESEHLSTWLSNRVGTSIPIPSLNDLGFEFLGGRLLTGEKLPAAMLMYQNAKGRRIVLYVSNELTEDANVPMAFERSPAAGIVTWVRNGTGFGVVGGFPEDELMPAANLIRAQFSI